MKHYKAIFFDWDGTAVLSRKAPVEDAVNAMRPLLDKGVKLCIVSGTTYENIAGGKLHSYFTPKQLENLYLGLGRGAFDYGYDATGQPTILVDRVPDAKGILAVHDACYRIHRELLEKYGMNTDIVFSRPNYCKIDLMPANNRGENLFLQEGEAARLQHILQQHGIDSIETTHFLLLDIDVMPSSNLYRSILENSDCLLDYHNAVVFQLFHYKKNVTRNVTKLDEFHRL